MHKSTKIHLGYRLLNLIMVSRELVGLRVNLIILRLSNGRRLKPHVTPLEHANEQRQVCDLNESPCHHLRKPMRTLDYFGCLMKLLESVDLRNARIKGSSTHMN